MAFLAALPALGSALGGLSTALSIGGTLLGGFSAMQSANYDAQVATQNAKIAEQNSQKASLAAQKNSLESDQQTAGVVGEQLAAQSASGLTVGGGSALAVRKAAQTVGRTRAKAIRDAGTEESIAYNQQAADFKGQAAMSKASGRMSMLGAVIGAGSSLAGSAKPGSALATKFRNNSSYGGTDPWAGLRVRNV